MKELKYPIKYAIMPMEEHIGWYPGLSQIEPEYGTVANIVSKCYVIKSQIEYLNDGNSKTQYGVVFPYNENQEKLVIPEYNIYGTCTNAIVVDQVFDTFESAKKIANKKNDRIVDKTIEKLPYDQDFASKIEELRRKHQETLNKYQKIEEAVEQATNNISITKTKNSTLEELVIKISESDFYNKIESILTPQEKEYLKSFIETKTSHAHTSEKPPVKRKI